MVSLERRTETVPSFPEGNQRQSIQQAARDLSAIRYFCLNADPTQHSGSRKYILFVAGQRQRAEQAHRHLSELLSHPMPGGLHELIVNVVETALPHNDDSSGLQKLAATCEEATTACLTINRMRSLLAC